MTNQHESQPQDTSRRDFLRKSALAASAAGATAALGGGLSPAFAAPQDAGQDAPEASNAKNGDTKGPWKILNAYYFRSHMYTCVPSNIRRDMEWMAQQGTNAVTISILEQDFDAAVQNVDIICAEAHRVGIRVHAVPSRWGNLVAGSPKVPSSWGVKNTQYAALDKKGKPKTTGLGPISSIHYPEVVDFVKDGVERILTQWPIDGIIWDEPKTLTTQDFSPPAVAKKPAGSDDNWYTDTVADFFGEVSAHAKSVKPDVVVSMFVYSSYTQTNPYIVERCAQIPNIDYFGCDGRPWRMSDDLGPDGSGQAPYNKVLLPNAGEFIDTARRNGKGGCVLIENFSFDPPETHYLQTMERTMPEVVAMRPEHLIYYYYGRSIADPDRAMKITSKVLKDGRAHG
ncbi:twin-arginine translocation signal domain-containing protein [Streptomyces sp. NPDC000994]